MKIIEYEDRYLEDVKDLLVELEEYILSIDEDNLDQLHPEYRDKMAMLDLEKVNNNIDIEEFLKKSLFKWNTYFEKEFKKEEKSEKVAEVREEVVEEVKEEKPVSAEKAPKIDLTILTVNELRELAKKKEIKGYSKMKKEELIEALK